MSRVLVSFMVAPRHVRGNLKEEQAQVRTQPGSFEEMGEAVELGSPRVFVASSRPSVR